MPQQLLDHLIAAAMAERDRLNAIHTTVGENWPSGFNANDIPLYDSLVTCLKQAVRQRGEVNLDLRSVIFLLISIPAYVSDNRHRLSEHEYQELNAFYNDRWPSEAGQRAAFPE